MPRLLSDSTSDSLALPSPAQVGRVGLYAFMLFFQLNASIAYGGLLLMAMAFAAQHRDWRALLGREAAAWLCLGLGLLVVCYALGAAREFPETAQAQWTASYNWLHGLLFIPVSWALALEWRRLGTVLAVCAAGLLVRISTHTDWADIGQIAHWNRTGFGMTETVFSPLAGGVVLGLLLLAPRALNPQQSETPLRRWVRASLWLCGLLILLESLIVSQTRSVWLALALAGPVALLLRYWTGLGHIAWRSPKTWATAALALILAGLLVQQNATSIMNRLQAESLQAPEKQEKRVIEGETVVMTSSMGYRLLMWRIGLGRLAERPWLGWGPGTTEMLLKQAGEPLLTQHVTTKDGRELYLSLPHLHNLYLEVLVRFGLLGGVLFFALPWLLLKGVWNTYRHGQVPWDYTCLMLALWGFAAIQQFFDFQVFKFAWRNYCVILAALSFAGPLQSRRMDA